MARCLQISTDNGLNVKWQNPNIVANGVFNFVNEIFTDITLFDIKMEFNVVINQLHLIIKDRYFIFPNYK